MNTVDELIEKLTPEMVASLKQAIALGKFPDERPVTQEQKELMLEAIIRYEAQHTHETERTGFIDRSKATCEVPDPAADLIPTRRVDDD
jgi:Uncharacterized protein conserved in bacteria